MIAVTGATGHLGRLVIEALLARGTAPGNIVALVRSPDKAADLAARGVVVRPADYHKPETLGPALAGVDKLLLISSSDFDDRAGQHRNVVDAAKAADVSLIAYTSIPRADVSPMILAIDHKATEDAIRAAGLPFVFLRNGWYAENYAQSVAGALAMGGIIGAAGEGRISFAPRADYAEAAAVALTGGVPAGSVLELGGDTGVTMADLAALVAGLAGKPVGYTNMPEADYKAALISFGLPEGMASVLAQSDAMAAEGWLEVPGHTLAEVIGHATTPPAKAVAALVAEAQKAIPA